MRFTSRNGQDTDNFEKTVLPSTDTRHKFEVCVFHRLKGCFCELIKYNRKAPLRNVPGTFEMISVKAGK